MRSVMSRLFLVVALLTLSACFVSDGLLFTPRNAAYPFGTQTAYVHYTRESGPQGAGWTKSYGGKITLGDDRIYTETHRDGDEDISVRFLLYAIGEGYYVAADVSELESSKEVYYDLLKVEGKTAYLYGLDCANVPRDDLVARAITPPDEDGFCVVTSLDGLIRTFKGMLAGGWTASEKYELGS